MKTIFVRILLIEERDSNGKRLYTAKCVEYNLAAQGKTPDEARKEIHKVLTSQIFLDLKDNIEPFSMCKKAPPDLQKLFKSAKSIGKPAALTSIAHEKIGNPPILEITEWRFYKLHRRFIPETFKKLLNRFKNP